MDSSWVEHLIEKYSSGLLRYLISHTRTREDAEDILQDVFVSVYEHCAEFDPERCNEQAWLFIIAKRKLVSYYRAFKQQDSLDEMEDWQLPGDSSMDEAVNLMSARQSVAKALNSLDERSRQIIIHRFFDGLSAEETGRIMGLSAGNVRTIQSRALSSMQKTLDNFDFSNM